MRKSQTFYGSGPVYPDRTPSSPAVGACPVVAVPSGLRLGSIFFSASSPRRQGIRQIRRMRENQLR